MNCFELLLCVSFLMTMMTLSWPFHAVIRASFLTYSDEAQSPTRLVKERDTHIKNPKKITLSRLEQSGISFCWARSQGL